MTFEGTKALVVGMEKSGRAVFEFLHAQGAEVTATDLKPLSIVDFELQTDELFDEPWNLIVPSPGVPLDLPGIERAKARGVKVIGEVELAAPYLRGPVIGITGTNGKTTTTSLVGHILQTARVPSQTGGNIGTPVIAMTETSRPGQWNVLELSSFQLETVSTFRSHVAVCLNVTQNHLDRHHTFENYASAKGNLFRSQQPGDYAVLNADDETCRSFAALTPAQAVWFTGREIEQLLPLSEIPIPGMHNAENVMAAAAAAGIAGVSEPQIAAAVKTFKAVEHRLEFVAEINGVRFYNDSKATSVDATLKALDSFRWRPLGNPRRQGQGQRLHSASRSAPAQSQSGAPDRRGGGKDRIAARRRHNSGSLRHSGLRCCGSVEERKARRHGAPGARLLQLRSVSKLRTSRSGFQRSGERFTWRKNLKQTGFSSLRWF